MTLLSLSILLIAAAMHTAWNLILKQFSDTQLATWWASLTGTLVFLPLFLFGDGIPPASIPYMIFSGIFEACYFMLLAAAYRSGDFSAVYPLARGTAPALTLTGSILFLGETPSIGGVLGVGILIAGLFIVGSSAWRQTGEHAVQRKSILLALSVAVCIALYSLIDGAAMDIISPLSYMGPTFILTSLLVSLFIVKRYPRTAITGMWRQNWRRLVLIGVLMSGGYVLVLWAYSMTPVSYASPIRSLSIVLAALVGWLWLKEGFGIVRVVGSFVIVAGILMIALAG